MDNDHPTIITLSEFISQFYASRPGLHRMHTDERAFKRHYLRQYGISDYLRAHQGHTLSHTATLELALHFLFDLAGSPEEVDNWLRRTCEQANVGVDQSIVDYPISSWQLLRRYHQAPKS